MMKIIEGLEIAQKEIELANKMSIVTFSLLSDKNVFLGILEHISRAILQGIDAFLEYEKRKKIIRSLPENPQLRIKCFLNEYAERFSIFDEDKKMIMLLIGINQKINKLNFFKKNTFYFLNDELRLDSFTFNDVNNCIERISKLINQFSECVQNERRPD